MKGEITADLSAMTFENMALLFGGIAALIVVAALAIFVLVRKMGISIGPIRTEQRGQSSMHNMNDENAKIEQTCQRQMRQTTGGLKIHISNIFAVMKICPIARVAISSVIRLPMYESIANNHFTTELMPENYDSYRARIIEMMRDEYIALAAVSKDINCGRDTLPEWAHVKEQLVNCVDLWLRRIIREIAQCCEKKLKVYRKYLAEFEQAKDAYRMGIVKACIEKNEKYIVELKIRQSRHNNERD